MLINYYICIKRNYIGNASLKEMIFELFCFLRICPLYLSPRLGKKREVQHDWSTCPEVIAGPPPGFHTETNSPCWGNLSFQPGVRGEVERGLPWINFAYF